MTESSEDLHIQMDFNPSVYINASLTMPTTFDVKIMMIRERIEKTGIVQSMVKHLHDPRDPNQSKHSLEKMLLLWFVRVIQGLDPSIKDSDVAPALKSIHTKEDGNIVVHQDSEPISQSMISGLWSLLGLPNNFMEMEKGLLRIAVENILARNGGNRPAEVILDVGVMPTDSHGMQPVIRSITRDIDVALLPLLITCAVTGDILGTERLRDIQHKVIYSQSFAIAIGKHIQACVSDRVIFRLNADFNRHHVFEDVDRAGLFYVMRFRKNKTLMQMAEAHFDENGSSLNAYNYVELTYRANNWNYKRRMVMIVKPRQSELYEDYFFLLTNLDKKIYSAEDVANMYEMRGKSEKHQNEINMFIDRVMESSAKDLRFCNEEKEMSHKDVSESVESPQFTIKNGLHLLSALYVYQILVKPRTNPV